mgnify:CR=1 FL=1
MSVVHTGLWLCDDCHVGVELRGIELKGPVRCPSCGKVLVENVIITGSIAPGCGEDILKKLARRDES